MRERHIIQVKGSKRVRVLDVLMRRGDYERPVIRVPPKAVVSIGHPYVIAQSYCAVSSLVLETEHDVTYCGCDSAFVAQIQQLRKRSHARHTPYEPCPDKTIASRISCPHYLEERPRYEPSWW